MKAKFTAGGRGCQLFKDLAHQPELSFKRMIKMSIALNTSLTHKTQMEMQNPLYQYQEFMNMLPLKKSIQVQPLKELIQEILLNHLYLK